MDFKGDDLKGRWAGPDTGCVFSQSLGIFSFQILKMDLLTPLTLCHLQHRLPLCVLDLIQVFFLVIPTSLYSTSGPGMLASRRSGATNAAVAGRTA